MDVLVCLANYGDGQLDHLQSVLEGYCAFSSRFRVFLIVDTTVPLDLSPYRDRLHPLQFLFKPEIRHGLAFVHRQHMMEQADNYDLFIYSENDVLIREENLEAYLRVTERLPPEYLSGFLRYETRDEEEEYYLIDVHPDSPAIKETRLVIEGHDYFTMHNLHQGCWILTRSQLKRAMASGGFDVMPHYLERDSGFFGILECGASDVYLQCGFAGKVLPHEGIEALLVHHLPDKYVRMGGRWSEPGALTLRRLKEILAGQGRKD